MRKVEKKVNLRRKKDKENKTETKNKTLNKKNKTQAAKDFKKNKKKVRQ